MTDNIRAEVERVWEALWTEQNRLGTTSDDEINILLAAKKRWFREGYDMGLEAAAILVKAESLDNSPFWNTIVAQRADKIRALKKEK